MANNLINNLAQITFDSITVQDSVSLPYGTALQITKTAVGIDNFVIPGQHVTFNIEITNPNTIDVTNALFKDTYYASVWGYVNNSFTVNGLSVTPTTTNPVTYTIDEIPANETVSITLVLQVLESYDSEDGTQSNFASITYDENTVNTQEEVLLAYPLTLTKTTTNTENYVESGDIVHFILTVSNPNRNTTITNILVEDLYDEDEWTYITNSLIVNSISTIPDSVNPLQITILSLPPQQIATIEFDLSVV